MDRRDFGKGLAASAVAVALAPRAHAGFGPYARGGAAAQTYAFNYFISTSGSDTNPGTLASPWALTSLEAGNSNQTLLAGKKVGLIGGVYNVYAKIQSGSYSNVYLQPLGGTSGSPTVIASCDASGNYSRGAAIISADSSGGQSGGTYPTVACGILGQNYSSSSQMGNLTIDGIGFTRSYQQAVFIGYPSGSGEGGPTGVTIKNCEIYDIAGAEAQNVAGIYFHQLTGALLQNNVIHKVNATSGSALWDVSGMFSFNCHSNVYEYNTVYDCPTCFYDKNGSNGNHTYRYNYFETPAASSGSYAGGFSALYDMAGGLAGDVLTLHHNILIGPQILDGNQGASETNPTPQGLVFYNNTCRYYETGGQAVYYLSDPSASPPGDTQNYNNIFTAVNGGSGQDICYQQGGAITLSNYNCYSAGISAPCSTANGTSGLVTYSLASWQSTLSLDGNSIQSNPLFTNPGVTLTPTGYQLGTGSPCIGAGRVGGVSAGTAIDMGAWGYDPALGAPPSIIGANFSAVL